MESVYRNSDIMKIKKRNEINFSELTVDSLIKDGVIKHAKRIYIIYNEAKIEFSIKEELDKID